MGTSAYMDVDALRRLAGEGDSLTGAYRRRCRTGRAALPSVEGHAWCRRRQPETCGDRELPEESGRRST